MDPYRKNKLSQAILEVLGELIQAHVKDPRVGLVTLGAVKLNRDGSVAEVFFSVLGDEDERRDSLRGLKKAKGFMQSKLTRALGLRQAPDLRFVYDDSVERGLALDSLLDEMKERGELQSEGEKKRNMCLDDLEPPLELLTGLRAARRVWVVPHHNPDPDAVGSALALGEALRALGRDVRVLCYPDPAAGLGDLPGFGNVTSSDDAEAVYADEQPDTLVLVDCHRIDRTGPLEETLARFDTRLCIDHHMVSGRRAPEAGWVDARACSTCTLVHQVIGALGDDDEPVDLTLDMATNIYAGLVNDTGGFRFSNTLPFTFELARRLSAMGVDTAAVAAATLHRHRPAGLDLMQRVLGTLAYHGGGKVATLHATREMVAETGGSMSDTEGFVNIATSVDGVRYVAFLKDLGDDTWRVSLRAKANGDVQAVAARHGGGGHKQASGCTIEGTVDDVTALLVAELVAASGA